VDFFSHLFLGFVGGQGLHLDKKKHIFFIIACIFPDFDSISLIAGFDAWYQFHRGPLHSFPVIMGASFILAVLYHLLVHPPRKDAMLFPLCLAGMSSHLILDLITPWRIPVLWPFSAEKISYNLSYFFDVVFFTVFLIAVILVIKYRNQKKTRVILVSALLLVSINFGIRFHEKQAAIDTLTDHGNEIIPMPTLRLDRWWIFTVTPADSGYIYDIYEVNSLSKNVLNNTTVESPFVRYEGPAEPPIDSPEQAVFYSKKDKTVGTYVDGLYLPAVTVENADGIWYVFWYDVSSEVIGTLSGGISITMNEDGTILAVERITEINIHNDLME
jgi:membrane-bound metal-dependent hydrolase YbcI (DUF457 family)